MTEPLRRGPERPNQSQDLGDVLASIRRLIAQEGAASQRAPNEAAAVAGSHAPLRETLTAAAAVPARTVPDSASLSLAVDAAAARMADTARRIEAARSEATYSDASGPVVLGGKAAPVTPIAPFRLHPDALIPPAEQPAWAGPNRLNPGALAGSATPPRMENPNAVEDDTTPAASAHHTAASNVDGRPVTTLAGPAIPAQPAAIAAAPATGADPAPALAMRAEAALPDTSPFQAAAPRPVRDVSLQPVSLQSDPSQQENAAMQLTADRPHATITPHPAAANPLPSMGAAASSAPANDTANDGTLLRQLLRETIRAELSAELDDRLNDKLRQIVRQEIASALSAALSDALRLPATR